MPKRFETDSVQPFLDQFRVFEKQLNGEAQSPLHTMRKDALDVLARTGFPTLKHDDWRSTSLKPILNAGFHLVERDSSHGLSASDIQPLRASFPVAAELVFVNGVYDAELSRSTPLPDAVIVSTLAEAMEQHPEKVDAYLGKSTTLDSDSFAALNTAFLQNGVFVYVPKGAILEEPVHAMFVHTGKDDTIVTYPRLLVVAEESATVKVVESHQHVSGAVYFSNAVAEIYAGDNAQVEHYNIQLDSEQAFSVGRLEATLGRDTKLATRTYTFGGALVRNNIRMELHGEGATGIMDGLFVPRGKQHVDNHTIIDHAVPHCESHETFKGLLHDESRGAFSGKIIVRQDAQKTDAKQSSQNILLSDKAHMDTKPQLEIYADDVRCTHGATVGQLDDKQLFYLRSRGIDREEAFSVLSYAFASEIIHNVSIGGLRTWLDEYIHQRLGEAAH